MSMCTCSFSFKNYHFSKKTLVLKFTASIHSRRDIRASSDNRTSEQTSNRPNRIMISPRTVCFVYFALLFGTPHANSTDTNNISTPVKSVSKTNNITTMTNEDTSTSINRQTTNSPAATTKTPVHTQATPKPEEELCIFLLSGKYHPQLIMAGLTVGCLVLLLTTLICACQVCHLRGIISSLQPRYDKSDRQAVREKDKSPYRDEGQVDGHPTETCFMLSEVTTTQEERREDEENKTDTEEPSTDPNGDVTQENYPELDAKVPENFDTGV